MALWRTTRSYRAMPGPWLNQTVADHNISRIGIFAVCCLTLAIFYFAVLKLPISHMAANQQLPSIANPLEAKRSPTAVASAAATAAPSAAPTQVATVAAVVPAPAAVAPPSAAASALASAQASASARPAPAAQPTASHAAAAGNYTSQAGDTLFSIARHYNVSVQTLASANKLADAGSVKVGQKLEIP
jgi:LysM repeat protein